MWFQVAFLLSLQHLAIVGILVQYKSLEMSLVFVKDGNIYTLGHTCERKELFSSYLRG